MDALALKLPVFGMILRKVAVCKIHPHLFYTDESRCAYSLPSDTVAQTAGNIIVEDAILSAKGAIREGERIAKPLGSSKVFPTMVVSMIAIGEETGNLTPCFPKSPTSMNLKWMPQWKVLPA